MMANKTIYVADADLPLYEQAQALAGGNLSSAIATALRQFVERAQREGAIDIDVDIPMASGDEGQADQSGFAPIVVKVGQGGAYTLQRFYGRLLGKQHMRQPGQNSIVFYRVYQTKKGALALHVVNSPDWSGWSNWGDWRNWKRGKRDRAEERKRERRRDRADEWTLNFGGFTFNSSPIHPPVPRVPPAPPNMPATPDMPNPPNTPTRQAPEDERSGAWWQTSSRLEVYNSLDELRPHIPAELAMVVAHRLTHGASYIEDLDI